MSTLGGAARASWTTQTPVVTLSCEEWEKRQGRDPRACEESSGRFWVLFCIIYIYADGICDPERKRAQSQSRLVRLGLDSTSCWSGGYGADNMYSLEL